MRTPTPWELYPVPDQDNVFIAGVDTMHVATAELEADAAFIVTACNSHAANLARIAELEGVLRYLVSQIKGSYMPEHPVALSIAEAQAALAKGQA